ncbi:hypothetical protein P3T27_007619 [Kitasatospora sp. MAA19]|uniref:hypothetical protein n=1 Tax=unclassified Kitasatospora TaxID=2633591 RepID=UPI00247401E5|nr:hypothetical protein [Kitasatospora sp. MAA19]MDH6710868.1 hypothetical protein [Kitasatospora sp. MAA19]
MFRTILVRTAVAGAAVLVSALGAMAVNAGDPVRQSSPTAPSAQVCGGSANVHCLSGHIVWNGTGLVLPPGV